ncbi:MAG: SpoIIE family protein phosphatase [Bacillota bacterium]|nr:SpoIIE family protein phosphatase [Bacillota bacterium]
MEGIKYRKNEFTMEQGDKLFLYTDGVTEATDTKKINWRKLSYGH